MNKALVVFFTVVCCLLHQARASQKVQYEEYIPARHQSVIDVIFPGAKQVEPPAEGVTVHVGAALVRLVDFDETNAIATFSLWERYLWNYSSVEWNPELFNDQAVIRVSPDENWIPDIVCYTDVDQQSAPSPSVNLVVYSSGDVLYIPQTLRRIACLVQGDGQSWACPMIYGSWTFDGNRIKLDLYGGSDEVDLMDYTPHPVYDVAAGITGGVKFKYYPCCPELYPAVHLPVIVSRRQNDGRQFS